MRRRAAVASRRAWRPADRHLRRRRPKNPARRSARRSARAPATARRARHHPCQSRGRADRPRRVTLASYHNARRRKWPGTPRGRRRARRRCPCNTPGHARSRDRAGPTPRRPDPRDTYSNAPDPRCARRSPAYRRSEHATHPASGRPSARRANQPTRYSHRGRSVSRPTLPAVGARSCR